MVKMIVKDPVISVISMLTILYGWAMSRFLPTGGFRLLTEKEIYKVNSCDYHNESGKGLTTECDLEYRK